MTSTSQPLPLTAELPDQLPEVDTLPTLATAALALFEEHLPGLLGRTPHLLQFTGGDGAAERSLAHAHALTDLVESARLGQTKADLFDPAQAVLSSSASSLAEADLLADVTLAQVHDALKLIDAKTVLSRFEIDAQTYWEVPTQLSLPPRQLAMEQQVRASLADDVQLLESVGTLTAEARALIEDIVEHPRVSDRSLPRGVYDLTVHTGGAAKSFSLPGMLVLSEIPAGYDPKLSYVTERQALTGEAVLYCSGYFGFILRHDHLQATLDGVCKALLEDRAWGLALLMRLAPEAQQALLEEWEREDASFEVRAGTIDDNPFEHLARQQCDAWRASVTCEQPGVWDDRIGLDVSRARSTQVLLAFEAERQSLRAQLPDGLRTLAPAQQDVLDGMLLDIAQQQSLAEGYWQQLPAFEDFARDRIRAELRKDGQDLDPRAVTVEIDIVEYSPELPGSELAPGVTPDPAQGQSVQSECSLLEYIAMRMDARADASWTVNFSGVTQAQSRYLSSTRLTALIQRLDLQTHYRQAISDALKTPADGETKSLHQRRHDAATGLFEKRLRLDAFVAHATGDLDDSGYQAVQGILDHPSPGRRPMREGRRVELQLLTLGGNSLRDVLIFHQVGESSLICYTPGHPSGKPFRRHGSRSALRRVLAQELEGIQRASQWPASTEYWVSRFGRHQLGGALPLLQRIADGKTGADLATQTLNQPIGKAVFNYRVAYLLAEGNSLAVSDAELRLARGLDIAVAVFRVLSALIPARVMTMLDLAELGYYMFNSYAALASGQREQAGTYALEAMTSLSGLANAKFYRFRAPVASGVPLRLVGGNGTRSVAAIDEAPTPQGAPFVISHGPRNGLLVFDGRLNVALQGRYYPVYEVRDPLQRTSTFHIGSGAGAQSRSLFSNPDPRIERDPRTGDWLIVHRPGLLGGMDQALPSRSMPMKVMRKVKERSDGSSRTFRIMDGSQEVEVMFDLDYCCWYSSSKKRYYRLDEQAKRYLGAADPGPKASRMERQQARLELECLQRPMLPELSASSGMELLPKVIHQIWIGNADSLIAAHDSTLKGNIEMARNGGYQLHLHFLGRSGWGLSNALQLRKLRSRYPGATCTSLTGDAFFKDFEEGPQGEVFKFFLQPETRNYAAACDALRYKLLHEMGGVYMDMDDVLLRPLPQLTLRPGQLAVGGVVSNDALMLRGPNNSHFASLKGNPLLDAVLREMSQRFSASRKLGHRPKFSDPGFTEYMREISRVTGPGLLNTMRHRASAIEKALTEAKLYIFLSQDKGVRPERAVSEWVKRISALLTPLEDYIDVGNAHSWATGRR
ncbi:dermonecrotic toxin domain-containing protein [Pseudomonas putida]|uniref:dermonecrotic toxin domain-containing protein n=1 Tax=Pseudomonas putida TaxID=303 RepID=UPI00383AE013